MIVMMQARWATFRDRKKFNDAHDLARNAALVMAEHNKGRDPADGPPFGKHPAHDASVLRAIDEIKDIPYGKEIVLSAGDSLQDIPRKWLTAIDVNASISGSVSVQIKGMLRDTNVSIKARGLTVKAIVIGSGWGNEGLQYRTQESALANLLDCLNYARELYPTARLVVHGVPPVYDLWATKISAWMEINTLEWCIKDGNAVFLPLQRSFGKGLFGLQPTICMSSDGTHMSQVAAYHTNRLIIHGIEARPGTVVDRVKLSSLT